MAEHLSKNFKIRTGGNISVGMANLILIEIWETAHSYACKYLYAGAGVSLSIPGPDVIDRIQNIAAVFDVLAPAIGHRRINWGDWTSFSTNSLVDVCNFAGPRASFLQVSPGGRGTMPGISREQAAQSLAGRAENVLFSPYLEFWADRMGAGTQRLMVQLDIPAGTFDSIPAASLTGGALIRGNGPYFKHYSYSN